MATNGLVLIKPTSTAVTGGSASATINAGGSVTFTTCETLSLNGVFSSTYDNYIIDVRGNSNASLTIHLRLRVSGSDNSTANSYVSQRLTADNTTVAGLRETSDLAAQVFGLYNTQRDGIQMFVYGPNLAQPTAGRSVTALGASSAFILDRAWTHNQSTAYDGFTLLRGGAANNFSGLIKVYGLVK